MVVFHSVGTMDSKTNVVDTQYLTLQVLGKPRLLIEGRTVDNFPTAKTIALFGYLAIERHTSHTRNQLIDLFWHDYPHKKARQNLSQTLSRLRRLLGSAAIIQSNYHTVELAVDAEIALDVADFVKEVEATNRHAHVQRHCCPECHKRLAHSVKLVRGELLTGVEVSDGYDFEQWLLIERERLHQLHLEALFDLAQGSLEQGDHDATIAYARSQIALEPWRERGYLQLIRTLALNGQHAVALREYERMSNVLAAELGVQPSETAHQLLGEIQTKRLRPVVGVSAELPNNLPAALTPFIGRKSELTAITKRIMQQQSRLMTLIGLGGVTV